MMIIRGVNQPPVEVLLEMQHTQQQQLVKKQTKDSIICITCKRLLE